MLRHCATALCERGAVRASITPDKLQRKMKQAVDNRLQNRLERTRLQRVEAGQSNINILKPALRHKIDPSQKPYNARDARSFLRRQRTDESVRREEQRVRAMRGTACNHDELNIWFNPAQRILNQDLAAIAKKKEDERRKSQRRTMQPQDTETSDSKYSSRRPRRTHRRPDRAVDRPNFSLG